MGKKTAPTEEVQTTPTLKNRVTDKAVALKQKVKPGIARLFDTKKKKIISSIVLVVLFLGILFAIPFTRYTLLSPIVKKDVSVTVIDSQTKHPVSNVAIQINGVDAETNKDGKVTLSAVPVGQTTLTANKTNYETRERDFTVPVVFSPEAPTIELVATGRSVVVAITHTISGTPLADAVISYGSSQSTTNNEGEATLILPADKESEEVEISKDGFNAQKVTVKSLADDTQRYTLTPDGMIYYLSKASGKIDVMKSHLDGTGAEVAVAGTGLEADSETSLLSARDWKYSALLATRTGSKASVYLVNGETDELTVIDQGNASFSLVGWSGHNFLYLVYRTVTNPWDDKQVALKSFNADTRKITVIDESRGYGNNYWEGIYSYFATPYILDDEIVYLRFWSTGPYVAKTAEHNPTLISANPSTGAKKTVKTFDTNNLSYKLYEPQGVYVRVANDGASSFFEYEDGKLEQVTDTNDAAFNNYYPTYLVSPSDKKTFWYEPRNGKNTVFIGDKNAEDRRLVADQSDFTPYGWYGENDEYILLSKNGSELYIAPASAEIKEGGYQPLKISNYHKTLSYDGYGYGYGGR